MQILVTGVVVVLARICSRMIGENHRGEGATPRLREESTKRKPEDEPKIESPEVVVSEVVSTTDPDQAKIFG